MNDIITGQTTAELAATFEAGVERMKAELAPKRLRGTAAMSPEVRREVARKGGLAASANRARMAEIGRKGGKSVSANREHMSAIGRKGGAKRGTGAA